MIKNSIFFGITFNKTGNLILPGNDSAILSEIKISKDTIPILRIINTQDINRILEINQNNIDLLQLKIENQIYTLVDNEIDWNYIYPKYILLHSFEYLEDIKFEGLHINLTYLSEWFITNNSSTNVTSTGFVREVLLKQFDVKIESLEKKFSVSNSYHCYSEKDDLDNSKMTLEECPTIDISCIDNTVELEDIKTLNHDMNLIFSFLTGFPIATRYLWGSLKLKKGNIKWVPIYFLNSFKENKKVNNNYEFLTNYNYLLINNKFTTIFENYYSESKILYFKKMWGRLYGLLSYNDVWDYELLGYVSILDQYLARYVKNKCIDEKRLSKKQFSDIKKSLIETVLHSLNKEEEKLYLESLKKQIENLQNTTRPFFIDKFDFLISNIDLDIKSIISFSSENFNFLKNLRNDIAHGNDIDYKNLDYTNIGILQSRIILLLFYLLHNDLGLSKEDFIENLYISFYYHKWNSKINIIHLDRISQKIKFILLDDVIYNQIKIMKPFEIILEKTNNHIFTFNSEKTISMQNNWPSISENEFKDIRAYIKSLYKDNEIKDVEYSSAYIENSKTSEVLLIHGLGIVTKINV